MYQPIDLAELARFIAAEPDFDTRWRLVVEFLKEYHQAPGGARQRLLARSRRALASCAVFSCTATPDRTISWATAASAPSSSDHLRVVKPASGAPEGKAVNLPTGALHD